MLADEEMRKMQKKICPSLMCCDIFRLREQLRIFEEEKIEYLHVDVMDGEFVPNYTLGTDFVRQIRRATDIPLDIHLMIREPERKISFFELREGDLVSVHAESTVHLQRALQQVRNQGARPLVALNPATPLSALDYVLEDVDGVLLMTVNPGYAGQKLVPQTLGKITDCRRLLDGRGYPEMMLEVDGNVSLENALLMKQAGADLFVAGSSSIFKNDLKEGIRAMRRVLAS